MYRCILWTAAAVALPATARGACICNNDVTTFPGVAAIDPDAIAVSPETYMVEGVDIGHLISVGGNLVTQNSFQVKKGTGSLANECPAGYRLPTEEEVMTWAGVGEVDGEQFLTSAAFLGMEEGINYMTGTKTHPGVTGGGDSKAWVFKALKFSTADGAKVVDVQTYFTDDDKKKAKCVMVAAGASIAVEGWPGNALEPGKAVPLSVTNRNVVAYHWFDSVTETVTTSKDLSYTPAFKTADSCGTLTVSVQVFGGQVMSRCYVYWEKGVNVSGTSPYFDVRTDIKSTVLTTSKKPNRITGLHFNAGTAPLAPHPTEAYSFVFYREQDGGALKVKKVGLEGEAMGDFDVGLVGTPFDIHVVAAWGYALLYKGEVKNSLYLRGVNFDGSTRFTTTIMNNGPDADKLDAAVDQVSVVAAGESPPFGMKIMYNPHNGRLESYNGMIAAEFAHYNLFGPDDGHTGDTVLFFDENSGAYMKKAWAWGTSHSLAQRLIRVDGKLGEMALGDAYPQQINFHVIDVENCCSAPSSSSIIPGTIPGNGGGRSLGRLGGLSHFDNGFIATYARRSGESGFGGANYKNEVGELGMVRYGEDLQLLQYEMLVESEIVNAVKSVRLGDHLLVGYALSDRGAGSLFLSASVADDDRMHVMLVDKAGNILQQATKRDASSISNNDDWEKLSDGRAAWTHVTADGTLSYYWLEIPENPDVPQFPTPAPPTPVPTPSPPTPPPTPAPPGVTLAPDVTPAPPGATTFPPGTTAQPSKVKVTSLPGVSPSPNGDQELGGAADDSVDKDDGWWVWVLVSVGVILALCCCSFILFCVAMRRRRAEGERFDEIAEGGLNVIPMGAPAHAPAPAPAHAHAPASNAAFFQYATSPLLSESHSPSGASASAVSASYVL